MKLLDYINAIELILKDDKNAKEKYPELMALNPNIYQIVHASRINALDLHELLFKGNESGKYKKYSPVINELVVSIQEQTQAQHTNECPLDLSVIDTIQSRINGIRTEIESLGFEDFDPGYYNKMLDLILKIESVHKFLGLLKLNFRLVFNSKNPNLAEMVRAFNLFVHDNSPPIAEQSSVFKNFPEQFDITPLSQQEHDPEVVDDLYWHAHIANIGFNNFLDECTMRDPAGTFTNYLSLIESRFELTGDYKLLVNDEMMLPSGETVEFELSPAKIVRLAGKFGNLQDPISFGKSKSEQQDRFINAYKALVDPSNYEVIMRQYSDSDYIQLPMAYRFVKESEEHLDGTIGYQLKSDDCEYNKQYKIGDNNFDHFGLEAQSVFETGLSLAIEKANDARCSSDEKSTRELLTEAVCYGLYACHYLIDLYIPGNMAPRKEILNALLNSKLSEIPDISCSASKKLLAAMLAEQMRDEEQYNTKRLVGNEPSVELDFKIKKGSNLVEQASNSVSAALHDIYWAFMNEEEPYFINHFRKIIPQSVKTITYKPHQPLFKVAKDGEFLKARSIDGDYQPMLNLHQPQNLASTFGRFFTVTIDNSERKLTETELEKYLEKTDSIQCKIQ